MASTDSERRLVLVSCTDPGAVQSYTILHSLLYFACWFKTGVVNVSVCGIKIWWQVQTRKEDWFWNPVLTLMRCNLPQSYTASSIFPSDSRQVLLTCMLVDLQIDGKYRLRNKICSGILYGPWCGAILHNCIWPHSVCQLIWDRCSWCVCLWTCKLVASMVSEGQFVLVSCTDTGAVQFYMVLYALLHFAFQFKTSVLNVCVCGLASWQQVQTETEDWLTSLSGPWWGVILHGLIHSHPFWLLIIATSCHPQHHWPCFSFKPQYSVLGGSKHMHVIMMGFQRSCEARWQPCDLYKGAAFGF